MAFTINNSVKTALLAITALIAFILGFNYLKGKNLLKKETELIAVIDDATGVIPGTSVQIKGVAIGSVKEVSFSKKIPGKVDIKFSISDDIKIPRNSNATVLSPSIIADKVVAILEGNATDYLQSGEYITYARNPELMDKISGISGKIDEITRNSDTMMMQKVSGVVSHTNDVVVSAQGVMRNIDGTINNINSVIDNGTKQKLQASISGLDKSVQDFNLLSAELAAQRQKIASVMNSLDAFAKNLNTNNDEINGTLKNVNTTTKDLAAADIDGTVNNLKTTLNELNKTLDKINSNEGTAGMLMNDKKLYNDLQGSLHSLDDLLKDLKAHPGRYISFSVFGKKQKNAASQ
jgi:phospholipid/cholesterol/gamma-HCH transport system substrate-binding protein